MPPAARAKLSPPVGKVRAQHRALAAVAPAPALSGSLQGNAQRDAVDEVAELEDVERRVVDEVVKEALIVIGKTGLTKKSNQACDLEPKWPRRFTCMIVIVPITRIPPNHPSPITRTPQLLITQQAVPTNNGVLVIGTRQAHPPSKLNDQMGGVPAKSTVDDD